MLLRGNLNQSWLPQVAGISGKVRIEGEDEEGIYTEAQGKAIVEALGLQRRNEVSSAHQHQPLESSL